MVDREKVIKGLECCISGNTAICKRVGCPYAEEHDGIGDTCIDHLMADALALLKAQEQRHRLEVHNIGNVDIPDGVTEEQFYALMNNVVAALGHTDMGESWPYDDKRW